MFKRNQSISVIICPQPLIWCSEACPPPVFIPGGVTLFTTTSGGDFGDCERFYLVGGATQKRPNGNAFVDRQLPDGVRTNNICLHKCHEHHTCCHMCQSATRQHYYDYCYDYYYYDYYHYVLHYSLIVI